MGRHGGLHPGKEHRLQTKSFGKVREDKRGEPRTDIRHLVAHPALVQIAREEFDKVLATNPIKSIDHR